MAASSTEDTQIAEGEADAVESSATVFADPNHASPSPRPASRDRTPAPGAMVGRYVVLSRLGAGAMGIVLAAYDPELDRKVALKLLRPRRARDHDAAQIRLQREAQALARLSHPNVVAVHDVGTHDAQVFLAMEFVEGETLASWMSRGPGGRPWAWRAVLEVFVAAGRGLAAAHREGLIHRDFKPDNVMIGRDGRVRVMDFGLARAEEPAGPPSPELLLDLSASSSLATKLTQTGAFMGTPAYMAPEQFEGGQVTARSDQFAFCVSVHEALFGERPFRGESVAQLAFAVTQGRIHDPPAAARVPAWLRSVIRRGLAPSPTDRYPDMDALLESLAAGEARRRRRIGLAGATTLSVALAGYAGAARWAEASATSACHAEASTVEEIWNERVREGLLESMSRSGLSYAPDTAARVLPYLDRQRDAIREATLESCLDVRVRRVWPDALGQRGSSCLEERRLELASLIEALSAGDPRTLRHAVGAAARLVPVEVCRDRRALESRPARAGDPQAERRVLERLWRADALLAGGHFEPALDVAQRAVEESEHLGSPALTARARSLVGELHSERGRYVDAEETLQAAYFEAASVNALNEAAEAATLLVYVVGSQRARPEEALLWARHARVALDEIGASSRDLRRMRLDANVAGTLQSAGRLDEARPLLERIIEERGQLLGLDHPSLASSINNLAIVEAMSGNTERSRELFERSLELRREALGPGHPAVATALHNLANLELELGRYEDVVTLLEQALEIELAALGPQHPDLASTLANLSSALLGLDELEPALAHGQRALAIREETLGPEHPEVAMSLDAVGNVERALGQWTSARAHHAKALEIRERGMGETSPALAYSLHGLALVDLHDGDVDAARAHAERALTLRLEGEAGDWLVAESRLLLAQILWRLPDATARDRAQARQLAQQAADAFHAHEPGGPLHEEARTWLATHPAPD